MYVNLIHIVIITCFVTICIGHIFLTASYLHKTILLTKTTAARNAVALSYHRVRGLYFPAVFLQRL